MKDRIFLALRNFGKATTIVVAVFLAISITSALSSVAAFVTTTLILLLSLVGLYSPLPQLWIPNRMTAAIMLLVSVIGISAAARRAQEEDQERLNSLRASDPVTYLSQVASSLSGEQYLEEAKQLLRSRDSRAYLRAIQSRTDDATYMSELKALDAAEYGAETARREEKKRLEQEKQEAERQRERDELVAKLEGATDLSLVEQARTYERLAELEPQHPAYAASASRLRAKIADDEKKAQLAREREVARLAEEERKRVASATAKMQKHFDEMEGVTWYHDKSTNRRTWRSCLYLYFGKKGDSSPWLRMKLQYGGEDWLFVRGFFVVADGQRFDHEVASFDRDNGGGDVWEWYDQSPSGSEIEMLKAIATSKKATVRFLGDKYRADYTITGAEKQALRNVLDAYKALGGHTR